ncbi:MAG: XRE family transcriptional regulator [Deltaproteobacteria bacterium]|nr:MAG: XRE family transcriptional regulator [Deltaproteobacteria bacterium]
MDKEKKKRLEAAGWRVGSVAEFLELTPEEEEFIEFKLALSRELKDRRIARGMTQAELAEKIGSSQSRVARMEAAHHSVTIDLLVRSLCTIGATRAELGNLLLRGVKWDPTASGVVPPEVIGGRGKGKPGARGRTPKR